MLDYKQRRVKRHIRIKDKVRGTAKVPRLVIQRSLKHFNYQIIDDQMHKTLLSFTDQKLATKKAKLTLTDKAKMMGQHAGVAAKTAGITAVVFDRAGYKYHGRVKAFADAAREAGLKF